MEDAIFSDDIFFHGGDNTEEADHLNEETFGLCDEYFDTNDWEKQHVEVSKLIEVDVKRKSQFSDGRNIINNLDDVVIGLHHKLSLSDEEEEIIENTISSLGLDDEVHYQVKVNTPTQNISFEESHLSWMSPTRGNEKHSDSLQELISPGGVWASPSRVDVLRKSQGKESDIVWNSPKAEKDSWIDIWSSSNNEDQFMDCNTVQLKSDINYDGSIIQKLIIESESRSSFIPSAIRVEDLERELIKNKKKTNMIPNLENISCLKHSPEFDKPRIYNKPSNSAAFGSLEVNFQKATNSTFKYNYNHYIKGQHKKNDWYEVLNSEGLKEIDYEEFIQIGPSKMMNIKEKKWIFKIGLMSLLGGDPNTSDYYFISLLSKGYVDESEIKSCEKEMVKKLEKNNQLVNYAQQQQQTKESHKPVKFKGSLGKLSITSVHHPRQIMDFSTPELEIKQFLSYEDSSKKKFLLYGSLEKMYSVFLSILDLKKEDSLNEKTLTNYEEKMNYLFYMFMTKHAVLNLTNFMSILKGRKLFLRVFLLFTQEQNEMLFIGVINILPFILKKDKEQIMTHFHVKLEVMLRKSKKAFKLKCIKLMRKIELTILMVKSTSILILATLLHSLKEKNPIIEWFYYLKEIPDAVDKLPQEIILRVRPHLHQLMTILGVEENVINN